MIFFSLFFTFSGQLHFLTCSPPHSFSFSLSLIRFHPWSKMFPLHSLFLSLLSLFTFIFSLFCLPLPLSLLLSNSHTTPALSVSLFSLSLPVSDNISQKTPVISLSLIYLFTFSHSFVLFTQLRSLHVSIFCLLSYPIYAIFSFSLFTSFVQLLSLSLSRLVIFIKLLFVFYNHFPLPDLLSISTIRLGRLLNVPLCPLYFDTSSEWQIFQPFFPHFREISTASF